MHAFSFSGGKQKKYEGTLSPLVAYDAFAAFTSERSSVKLRGPLLPVIVKWFGNKSERKERTNGMKSDFSASWLLSCCF